MDIEKLAADYEAGATARELATQEGCGQEKIRRLLHRHGVTLRPPGVQPLVLPLQAVRDYRNGASGEQIAQRYGHPLPTIYDALRRSGVEIRSDARRPRVGLPDEAIEMYDSFGWSINKVARHYNVAPQVVKRCLIEAGVPLHDVRSLRTKTPPRGSRSPS